MRCFMIRAISLIVTLLTLPLFSAPNSDQSHFFGDLFSAYLYTGNKKPLVITQVNSLDSSHVLAPLVNNNSRFMSYLMKNYAHPELLRSLSAIKDSVELNNTFVRGLKKDSIFTGYMSKVIGHYQNPQKFPADSVSLNEVLNITVKFFSILKLNEKGHYVGKVCVGLNSLKATEPDPKPYLEAFAFSTIANNMGNTKFPMRKTFIEGLKMLNTLHMGLDKEEKLFRAQGAIFMYMRNHPLVKEMVLESYKKSKVYLPFIIN